MKRESIVITDMSVEIGKGFLALKNISLTLPSGQIIGLIGPSGAGKTTLMRSIVGRQKIKKGTINILGIPAGTPKLREQLSYMTQGGSVYPDLTVRENLQYFSVMTNVKRRVIDQTVTDALVATDLTDRANYLVSNLSGGQKQRVSLAVALLGKPKILVLDEPTVGLDPVLREKLWKLFHQLASSGTTLLVSSHVMDEAARCDELVFIRDGHVLAQGTAKELSQKTSAKNLEESFIKLTEQTL